MRDLLRRAMGTQEVKLAAVIAVLCVGLTLATPEFASLQNLVDLLSSNAFNGILAAGLLVVLISGGIDMSFAAVASTTQYAALTAANAYGIGWMGVVVIALAIGLVFGLLNGWLISTLRTPAIIVTISTLNVIYGVLLTVTRGADIFALPDWFNAGLHLPFHTDAEGVEYAVNLQMVMLALALGVSWLLLKKTNFGRQIFALGGNADAAQRVGFNVLRLNLLVYGYMGVLAGAASLAHAQLVQSVSPTALVGRELDVVAAVVLGGASLNGGSGTVLGTVLGLALLAILKNGLVLLGVSSYWSLFSTGVVILAAVSMMAREYRKRQPALRRGVA